MRVKRGTASRQKHNKIRKSTRGMTHGNRVSIKRGKQAIVRSLQNATRDRKNRKRTFRQLWNTRINAGARLNGTTYSKLIANLKLLISALTARYWQSLPLMNLWPLAKLQR